MEVAAKSEMRLTPIELDLAVGPASDSQLLAAKFGKNVPFDRPLSHILKGTCLMNYCRIGTQVNLTWT